MSRDTYWAEQVARDLLQEPLPRRWAHTQGVAAQARNLADILGGHADLLTAAAWLHDIGYSPAIARSGFHPLDGARYVRDQHHADARLCALVAHHSCAVIEAEERGMKDVLLAEFEPQSPELTDALTYCDMTTGPDGRHLSVEERLTEIRTRYGRGHVVDRSIERATPRIKRSAHHVTGRLHTLPPRATSRTGFQCSPGSARSVAASTCPSDNQPLRRQEPSGAQTTQCSVAGSPR